jgi:transposase
VINKEKLRELYWEKGLTQRAIAKKLNVGQTTVRRYMRKYKIKSRESGRKKKNFITKKQLTDLYHRKGLSQQEIADKFDVSRATVERRMHSWNIETRDILKRPSRKAIKELYYEEGLTQKEISKTTNTHRCTIKRAMKKYGLDARDRAERQAKTDEEFRNQIYNLVGDEYTFLDEYKGYTKRIRVKHNKCGGIYKVTPDSFITDKSRCVYCFSSRGEAKIFDFLKKNKLNFMKEYKINGCENKKCLPFDFAVFDNNSNIIALIEYDGEQHYKPIKYFGGIENYKRIKENDKIKDRFCKDNGIKLIRIPYWDYDSLEEKLEKEIKSTA